ncbi:Bd3614 family nucleic acid deaminase [Pigmentibacter ruber]|nr:hypothetical protein GTC16762_06730 [Pigmentibacter ruber]
MQNIVPEQILYYLKKLNQSDYAFLVYQNTIYYAKQDSNIFSPLTAVTKLIQGISEQYKENAHYILRKKIYTSYIPTNMCLGMIKVAAKRFSYVANSQVNLLPISYQFEEIKHIIDCDLNEDIQQYLIKTNITSDNDCMQLANTLKEKVTIKNTLALSDRKIAGLLVDKNFNILAYGLNSNAKNKARHAEIDLIYRYYKDKKTKIPKHSKLFITLKPCLMCSNMLSECAEDITTIKIYYFEKDHGRFSKNTSLDDKIKNNIYSKIPEPVLEQFFFCK